MEFEAMPLYRLIARGTRRSLREAWKVVGSMTEEEIRQRSQSDSSTYLHVLVYQATEVYKRYQDLTPLVPLIYRLALCGINVNSSNHRGNTALHLACIRPHAESLCPHLIRIGVDPCVQNKRQCRIIHHYRKHKCHLVKGQSSAKSGLWNAVEKEDLRLVERLLRSWCRVNVRRNKSLKELAEETANVHLIKLLDRYCYTSELACAALACETARVRELVKSNHIAVDLHQRDESCDVPKPLIVAVEELGDIGAETANILRQSGADDIDDYQAKIREREEAFENCEFYHLVEDGSEESLLKSLDVIYSETFDTHLVSQREASKGWTHIHYLVDRYVKMAADDEEKARLLIRAIYRLALVGIDMNTRDSAGNTALALLAGKQLDQNLLTHLIRLGADPSLADLSGRTVNEELYEDKGKLVFDAKYRVADLPGLWVAVDSNDIKKAERWLKSWARVKTCKGDMRLIDQARSRGRKEIVQLMEEYEQINEFVCATFACDLKRMMDVLALGKGQNKVNTIDDFFHVGFTWDRHAEFMQRPVIITAMELCTPQVVDFMLKFGANLSKEHEECPPCGPVAFWAFRDHVNNENALVVARHADVNLRDEQGATMLHRAIKKRRVHGKAEVVEVLLDRGIDVAARDMEGSTARDYLTIHSVDGAATLRQVIDNHVLEMVNNDQQYTLETLLLEDYDHVHDIRGTKRNKTAREIADLKEFKEIIQLFADWEEYRTEVDMLHDSVIKGDLRNISKLAGEKRCAWGCDKAGRTLLHNAVLYERPEIVRFLIEQFPGLINVKDNLNRTPLHLCVCLKDRHMIWPILQEGGSDQHMHDVNNLSVYEYVRELENPSPIKDRPRGRRHRDYRPSKVIEEERIMVYGRKAASYELQRHLLNEINKGGLAQCKALASQYALADLSVDELDVPVLKLCVELKRQEVAKFVLMHCGARPHLRLQIGEDTENTTSLRRCAKDAGLNELAAYIKTCPVPEVPAEECNGLPHEQDQADDKMQQTEMETEQ